jgi:death on curing protein
LSARSAAKYVFLGLNGLRIEAEEPEVVRIILALAAGELQERDLSEWLRQHTTSR